MTVPHAYTQHSVRRIRTHHSRHARHSQPCARQGETFKVLKKVGCVSELIKTMVEGDADETEIPLPNFKGQVLSKVTHGRVALLALSYGHQLMLLSPSLLRCCLPSSPAR